MNKLIVVGVIAFFIFSFSVLFISSETINCYEENPLTKLKIKILYLTGNLNPFLLGVEPFSEQGGLIATQFNNFKRECLDKW